MIVEIKFVILVKFLNFAVHSIVSIKDCTFN